MSQLPNVKRFGLQRLCLIAIACAAFTVPADGQQPAERDDRNRSDAESPASDDEKTLRQALEEQIAIVEKQRAEAEEQYRRAMSELQRAHRGAAGQPNAELANVRKQLQAAHAQLAEVLARQQQAQQAPVEPLPENTVLRVYRLQYSKPQKLAEVLGPIFRNNAPRIAVDERANSLIVAGNERQLSLVEELAKTLDQEMPEIKQQSIGETLQVRIVWLLDLEEGAEPSSKLVSPQVIEALGELGFEHPKVVCQQATTLTIVGEHNVGRYHFQVPVLIRSQPWELEGQGEIEPMADSQFNLSFNLRFNEAGPQPGGGGRGGGPVRQGQLGGSIYTPLAHYTVMGTTTFVATSDTKTDPATGGGATEQHLSAFVVYLDRAKEFPASEAQAAASTSEAPR
jgi:hypothetical protein